MTPRITVIDYGLGNLLSVIRAFEHCGAKVEVTHNPADLARAERLVLPGVGAFADGMTQLHARGLAEPLKAYAAEGKPLLGICLGMQLLMDSSEEFGLHAGLGLIPGHVSAIPETDAAGAPHKIPHVGWNGLRPVVTASWDGTVLEGLESDAAVYFVHSFRATPTDPEHRVADCLYGGRTICAAVRRGAIHGCQFHPEKSGPIGLRILTTFMTL